MSTLTSEIELTCPCCGTAVVFDLNLKRIISYQEPASENAPELSDAHSILEEEAARRESIFEQSVSDEKGREAALSKRFEEALEQVKKEPVERPDRDFDLD